MGSLYDGYPRKRQTATATPAEPGGLLREARSLRLRPPEPPCQEGSGSRVSISWKSPVAAHLLLVGHLNYKREQPIVNGFVDHAFQSLLRQRIYCPRRGSSLGISGRGLELRKLPSFFAQGSSPVVRLPRVRPLLISISVYVYQHASPCWIALERRGPEHGIIEQTRQAVQPSCSSGRLAQSQAILVLECSLRRAAVASVGPLA